MDHVSCLHVRDEGNEETIYITAEAAKKLRTVMTKDRTRERPNERKSTNLLEKVPSTCAS